MLMHVCKLLNFWPQLYSKYPGYVVCVWVKSSVKFYFLLSKLYLCLLHGRFPTRENSPPLLRLANVLGADVGNSYNILKPSWRNSCSKPEIYMSVFFFFSLSFSFLVALFGSATRNQMPVVFWMITSGLQVCIMAVSCKQGALGWSDHSPTTAQG